MLKLTRNWRHFAVPVLISLCLVLSVMTAVKATGNRRAPSALTGNPPVAGFVSALQFAGDDSSYGSVTPGPATTGLTALTVEAWVNPGSISGRAEILAKDPLFFTLLDGKPSVYLGGTGNPGFHTSGTAVQAGVWSHVAATWDGTTVKIYLNGTETYSGSTSGTLASATPGDALGIGVCLTCAPLTTGFNGCIDEIRFWGTARAAASIQARMRQGLTGSESGLVAYYRCDEPSGTTLNDSTGNTYHATLTGSVMRKASGLADNFTTAEDTAFNGRLFGYDADNDALTYSIVTNGTKGIAVISDASTGAFTYTPASNLNGADSFTYRISDGSGDSAAVTVNLTITPVNDNPTITAGSPVTVQHNGSVSGVTIATVSDIESAAGSLTVTPTLPTGITVSNITNTNGTITADISAACNATAGANTMTLTVNDPDGGSATASLTVNVTAQTVNLTSNPISQTICPGSTALFTVAATGDGPFFYQWRKDGSPILGANSDNFSIVGASASDVASYDCVITSVNGCTSVTSNAATVTLRTATSITSQPVSRTVCAGSPVSFSVSADGTGTVSYQWRKNGSPISGATDSTFSLASATASDAGNYDCVVTAGCGSRTSSVATLTVNTAPTITSNPADRNTTVGATLHLTATADGSPTPEVRWQLSTDGGLNFNGINGATGTSLTLANVTLAMSGYKYRAIFSNDCGITYSAISTLTVSPAATTITIAAGTGSSTYGQAASFTASVLSGSDPITEGTVTFKEGSTVLGTAALNGSGQALFTTTALGAGSHGISAVYNGTNNYLSSTTGATAAHTVSKATLTVTASNATKVYGAALPTFTAVYSGFVNGDTSGVLSGLPDLTTTASAGSPVGTYPITAAAGTLTAANYNFTFVSGTLTVTKAALIVVADNQTRTYGTANPALTYTYSGFVNGDTASVISGTPSLSTTATSGSPVGAYPITVDVSGLSAANYSFAASNGALIVNKAALTVKADDAARTYGAANPAFTYTITGFVNGDTASVVSGTPSLTTTA
ncbi:MAG TPA: MBG domain-containing protein, partial [Blastocatellia bacterium]|nr:MBG domain-containing protein [Blastocatellia bacterium]